MRCLLIGNYGVGNLGDEALREYFLKAFPDIGWNVLSTKPRRLHEVPRLPCGFRSFFTPWWRTIGAYARSDAVVFGGGSLFTDSESSFACLLWWWHAFIARLLRKPIFLAFQGIGPLRTFLAQRLTKWVCVRAAFISVRDQASFERIVGWNVRVPPILSFDPIFEQRTKTFFSSGARRTLGIIPRANSYDEFMVAVSVSLNKPWDFVKIILLQSSADERAVGERIRRLVPGGVPVTIVDVHNFSELITSLSDVTEVVCQRYHGALAAMGLGIPVTIVPQREGDKLQELQVLVSTGRFADLSERVSLGQRALHSALSLAEKRRSC